MAKMENTKMEITLNPQDRRILKNLTRAIDRLAKTSRSRVLSDGEMDRWNRRLSEPVYHRNGRPPFDEVSYVGDDICECDIM